MTSQKIENVLNLALDATQEERLRSGNLEVGYDEADNTWDVIILYSGTLDSVDRIAMDVIPLLKNFAVVRIREEDLDELASLEEVIYIEKPKRLFFEVANGRRVSCIDAVQTPRLRLTGKGVLIGIIDSGIEYSNADFQNEDGTTRIRFLWDQTVEGSPPDTGTGQSFRRKRSTKRSDSPTGRCSYKGCQALIPQDTEPPWQGWQREMAETAKGSTGVWRRMGN